MITIILEEWEVPLTYNESLVDNTDLFRNIAKVWDGMIAYANEGKFSQENYDTFSKSMKTSIDNTNNFVKAVNKINDYHDYIETKKAWELLPCLLTEFAVFDKNRGSSVLNEENFSDIIYLADDTPYFCLKDKTKIEDFFNKYKINCYFYSENDEHEIKSFTYYKDGKTPITKDSYSAVDFVDILKSGKITITYVTGEKTKEEDFAFNTSLGGIFIDSIKYILYSQNSTVINLYNSEHSDYFKINAYCTYSDNCIVKDVKNDIISIFEKKISDKSDSVIGSSSFFEDELSHEVVVSQNEYLQKYDKLLTEKFNEFKEEAKSKKDNKPQEYTYSKLYEEFMTEGTKYHTLLLKESVYLGDDIFVGNGTYNSNNHEVTTNDFKKEKYEEYVKNETYTNQDDAKNRAKIEETCPELLNGTDSILLRFAIAAYFNFSVNKRDLTAYIYYIKWNVNSNITKYTTDYKQCCNAMIDGGKYFSTDADYSDKYNCKGDFKQFFQDLLEILKGEMENYLASLTKGDITKQSKESVKDSDIKYKDYVSSRLKSSCKEDEFFYVKTDSNSKHIPMNPYVDVEFRVFKRTKDKNGKYEFDWIPVSSASKGMVIDSLLGSDLNNAENSVLKQESLFYLESGNYFDGFEIEDKAGVKHITLHLKSHGDINLEKIIENSLTANNMSLSIDNTTSISKKNKELASNSDNLKKILEDCYSNFRIRFGYADSSSNSEYKENIIACQEYMDEKFLNRIYTKDGIVKPVLMYPWTYFKITDVKSNILNDVCTYDITAISSGAYVLDYMCLACGNKLKFTKSNTVSANRDNYGTPYNIIGKLAEIILEASNNTICFLSEEPGKIIKKSLFNKNENDRTKYNYDAEKYILYNDSGKAENSLTFPASDKINKTYNPIYNDSNQASKRENAEIAIDFPNLSTISSILNKLVAAMPKRLYALAKLEGKSGVYASEINYSDNSSTKEKLDSILESNNIKWENLRYQIYESKSTIDSDPEPKNRYFVRLYYYGPQITDENKEASEKGNEYLRVYNYNKTPHQVITSLSINDGGPTLGNYATAVNITGTGIPVTITALTDSSMSHEKGLDGNPDVQKNKTGNGNYGKAYLTTKNTIKLYYSNIDEQNDLYNTKDKMATAASQWLSAVRNQAYKGTITIVGDPFYYFDQAVEPGKYEIFLNANRPGYSQYISDGKINYSIVNSYFSGLYTITGIKQIIDSEGNFSTELEVVKHVF